jgi:hypothetical protein
MKIPYLSSPNLIYPANILRHKNVQIQLLKQNLLNQWTSPSVLQKMAKLVLTVNFIINNQDIKQKTKTMEKLEFSLKVSKEKHKYHKKNKY